MVPEWRFRRATWFGYIGKNAVGTWVANIERKPISMAIMGPLWYVIPHTIYELIKRA